MRIIKRKKGNAEFFSLQHSFRENGEVITREKYLGKTLPNEKELEKMKEELSKESTSELNKKLEKIRNNFQKEWETFPPSYKEKVLEQIAVAFTYNTNAIEGSKITLEETKEIVEDKISPNKPLRDVKETENHAKVFLEMLNKKEKITKELLLTWHKQIFGASKEDIAGRFRNHLVRVGEHLAPDWQDVDSLMKGLFDYVNNKPKDINVVEFAAITHYRFEKIHPFADGNGRIGRLLMNYLLWHEGYPMLIIDYKKRKSYNKAFLKDESNFVRYFLRRYLTIHRKRYSGFKN
ncbi:MAG: Fic family protein [Nanoarchaeota archaeon]